MKYSVLADVYEKLDNTSGKLEKTHIIANLLKETSKELLQKVVLLLNGSVFPSWSEEELGVAGQLMIKSIAKAYGISEKEIVKSFKKTGDLGLVVEIFSKSKKQTTLGVKELSTEKVFENLQLIAKQTGGGSQDRKMNLIAELLSQAKSKEAKYVVRTSLGELRIGVAEGIIRNAIAEAFNVSPDAVENAWFLDPDYGEIARIAKERGEKGLQNVKIEIGRPIMVLLAEKAPSLEDAVNSFEKVALEYKYDGARMCQPKGSSILGNPSIKYIDQLKNGDLIMSSNGKMQHVVDTFQRHYSGNIIEVKALFMPSFRLTPEHPIFAIKHQNCHWTSKQLCRPNCKTQNQSCKKYYRNYEAEFYPASEIEKNDFIFIPKYSEEIETTELDTSKIINFKRHGNTYQIPKKLILTDDLLEFFGWYCADGSSSSKWGNVSFALSANELEIAKHIKELIKKLFNLKASIRERKEFKGIEVYLRSSLLAELLSNLFGLGAKEKKIPDFILKLPKNKLLPFLKAHWKGDGSRNLKSVNITTASIQLAYQLFLAYSKLGILIKISKSKSTKRIIRGKEIGESIVFRLGITGEQRRKLDFSMSFKNRTWNRFFEVENGFFIPVNYVKKIPFDDTVYNIETEDHTYTNPFLLHNCIHKKEDKIIIFTRRLENITKAFPDVVEICKKGLRARECIVDGEGLAIDKKTGKPLPFQMLSQRIKRKYDIGETAKGIPIELNLFDIIYLNGKALFDLNLKERRDLLAKAVKEIPGKIQLAKQIVTKDLKKAEKFYKEALEAGQEGLIVKNMEAKYQPGRRVAGGWLKVKPVLESLDLVIKGAIWGTGRRAGWLGSYILACRDPNTGDFLECGMMGTGVKEKKTAADDITFKDLTNILKPYIEFERGNEVKIKPKVVVEIAYEEIQKSPTYSSGYALRFPRLLRLRTDKGSEEVDTVERLVSIYKIQKGRK